MASAIPASSMPSSRRAARQVATLASSHPRCRRSLAVDTDISAEESISLIPAGRRPSASAFLMAWATSGTAEGYMRVCARRASRSFSAILASREGKPSSWASEMSVRTTTSGCIIASSGSISPVSEMPASMSTISESRAAMQSERGTPSEELKLRGLRATRRFPASISASHSFTSVLPREPVMATTVPFIASRAAQPRL